MGAKVADLDRVRRVREVVDLGHARHPPTRHAGDDAGVAFPPALMRSFQAFDDAGDQLRMTLGSAVFQISCAAYPNRRSK